MRPQLIYSAHSREDQRALLIAQGWKPTGITAMDGRFEIVRQPKGAWGAKVTWGVWDYSYASMGSGANATLKRAKVNLQIWAEMVVAHELRCATDKEYRDSQPTRDSS